MQRSVPAIGRTSLLQRQPGSMVIRPITKSSNSNTSALPRG